MSRVIERPHIGRPGSDAYALLAPNNVFQRDLQAMERQADQTPGLKVADHCNLSNAGYSHNGEAPPNFYTIPKGEVGYATESGLTYTKAALTYASPTIYRVEHNHATQKVELRNTETEVPYGPETANGLQKYFEAVPMPDVTKILATPQNYVSGGTDREMIVLRFNLDGTVEMWEMWQTHGTPGAFWCHYGGYIRNIREWGGVFPHNWGARATSLACFGGTITLQDLVKVARGGTIDHVLGIMLPSTGPGWVSPATRSDKGEGNYNIRISEKHKLTAESEAVTNPAFTHAEAMAVPEGTMMVLPSGLTAAEFGITKPLELAIFKCLQGNPTTSKMGGLFIDDGGSGSCNFNVECPLSLGTKYSLAAVNALAGSPMLNERGIGSGGENEEVNYVPESWSPATSEGLAAFTEHLGIFTAYKNLVSIFTKQPFQKLETVKPFTE